MNSPLPVPSTRVGWKCAIFLTIVLFLVYYFVLYQDLERDYYGYFWNPTAAQDNSLLEVKALVPSYISPLVAQEMWVRVHNLRESGISYDEVFLIVSAESPWPEGVFLILCAEDGTGSRCEHGSTTIPLGNLPPTAFVTSKIWVQAQRVKEPSSQTAKFDVGLDFASDLDQRQVSDRLEAQFQAHGVNLPPSTRIEVQEAGHNWTIVFSDTEYSIQRKDQTLNVYLVPTNDLKITFTVWGHGKYTTDSEVVSPTPILTIPPYNTKLDDKITISQSFIKTILLPPWSNTLLPVLALLVAHVVENRLGKKSLSERRVLVSIGEACLRWLPAFVIAMGLLLLVTQPVRFFLLLSVDGSWWSPLLLSLIALLACASCMWWVAHSPKEPEKEKVHLRIMRDINKTMKNISTILGAVEPEGTARIGGAGNAGDGRGRSVANPNEDEPTTLRDTLMSIHERMCDINQTLVTIKDSIEKNRSVQVDLNPETPDTDGPDGE